ncbi:MAG: hypothetical protein ABI647_08290 [Gemmatimonadota bacterium]
MTRQPTTVETPDTARLDHAAEAVAGWLRTEFPGYLVRRRWRFIGARWLFQLEPMQKGEPTHELQLDVAALRSMASRAIDELRSGRVGERLREDPNVAYRFDVPGGLCRLWSIRDTISLPRGYCQFGAGMERSDADTR